MLDRILSAVDDSKECARVLRLAIELAQEISADLKVIIVLRPLPAYSSRSRCLRSSPARGGRHSRRSVMRFRTRRGTKWGEPGYMRMSSWSAAMKYNDP